MAKIRRRFYVARDRNRRQVLSLKFRPSRDVYGLMFAEVVGPFRTFEAASAAL